MRLTDKQLRDWLVAERDFWKLKQNGVFDAYAKGTTTYLWEALDQVIDVLGPVGEPDQIVSIIDARLGAGWTASLAKALGSANEAGDQK